MNAGKWLIVGVFAVAIAAAVAAWVHRYYRTDFVRERFGNPALLLVETSPTVEAVVRIGEQEIARRDVTRAPGILNVRHMIGSDFSYPELEPQEMLLPTQWELVFRNGQDSARFGFHHDCSAVMLDDQQTATVREAAAKHLRAFFAEQFPEQSEQMDRTWNVGK